MSSNAKREPSAEVTEEQLELRPTGTESAAALRQIAAERLAAHRSRREGAPPQPPSSQPAAPRQQPVLSPAAQRVRDAVAARYRQSPSYREYLEAEAARAVQKAQAEVEIAARTAQAVAQVQSQLLAELEQWPRKPAPVPPPPPHPTMLPCRSRHRCRCVTTKSCPRPRRPPPPIARPRSCRRRPRTPHPRCRPVRPPTGWRRPPPRIRTRSSTGWTKRSPSAWTRSSTTICWSRNRCSPTSSSSRGSWSQRKKHARTWPKVRSYHGDEPERPVEAAAAPPTAAVPNIDSSALIHTPAEAHEEALPGSQLRIFEVEPEVELEVQPAPAAAMTYSAPAASVLTQPAAPEIPQEGPDWEKLFLDQYEEDRLLLEGREEEDAAPSWVPAPKPELPPTYKALLEGRVELRVSPVQLRVLAWCADAVCQLAAFLLFATVAALAAGPHPHVMSLRTLLVGTVVVFLSIALVYQMLFFWFGANTPAWSTLTSSSAACRTATPPARPSVFASLPTSSRSSRWASATSGSSSITRTWAGRTGSQDCI